MRPECHLFQLTKVRRADHGEQRQQVSRAGVPQTLGMEGPALPPVLVEAQPLLLTPSPHPPEEQPCQVSVSCWDCPGKTPSTKEPVSLKVRDALLSLGGGSELLDKN